MKKVKIILTLILLSLIIVITGCNGNLRTPPWTEDELQQMQHEEQKVVPIAIFKFEQKGIR